MNCWDRMITLGAIAGGADYLGDLPTRSPVAANRFGCGSGLMQSWLKPVCPSRPEFGAFLWSPDTGLQPKWGPGLSLRMMVNGVCRRQRHTLRAVARRQS